MSDVIYLRIVWSSQLKMNSDDLLAAIYRSVTDYSIITLDPAGMVTSWNVGAENTHGYAKEEVIGESCDLIFTEEDRRAEEPRHEMERACEGGRSKDYRWHIRKDGSRFWADGLMTPIHDSQGRHIGFLKILKDVTRQKELEEELHRLARRDMLTGLASRASFDLMLEEMCAVCNRSGQMLNLLLLDLDHFKQVNDTLGHPAGDGLLKQVADRIRSLTRDADFIARLGGDEFAILQVNANSPWAGSELAAKLIDALETPFLVDGNTIHIGTSIGIVICPNDADHPEQLLVKADLALYQAKECGRNDFHYFTKELEEKSHQRHLYSNQLKHAVHHGEFSLCYQPKVECRTGKVTGIEALLRCSNQTLAALKVDELIDLAREMRLSQPISEWVIREAVLQLQFWKELGVGPFKISINICPPELKDDAWLQRMLQLIVDAGVDMSDIEVEVTERLAMDFEPNGLSGVNRLRENGISIALDDFGMGYSSLAYLTRLPIDTLKLDQEFLRNVPHHPQSCNLAHGLIRLALQLGLEVVAEGVESQEQADFLRDAHCTALQGFLISRPLTAQEMTEWLLQ